MMKKKNLYLLPELIKRWEREELTAEQAVGQMLLWLTDLAKRVRQLEANQMHNPTGEPK